MARAGLRLAVRRAHRWLGLALGALFVLAGLTGSALVFYTSIDGLLNPEIRVAAAGEPPRWETALATVHAAFPDRQGPWRFEVTDGGGAIPARYYNPAETAGHSMAPMMVWLSPDGRRVLRRTFWGDYAMTWIYDLHYRLQMGEAGQAVMGYAGIALLLLPLSGLWAWWPRRGSWRKALHFKRQAGPLRRLYDWHKLAGLAGLAPLVLLAATGVMLALPDETELVLARALSPVDALPRPLSAAAAGERIPVDAAVAAARRALPRARLAWIETPAAPQGAYRLRLQQPGDPSRRFPRSYVWIDQHDGRVLAAHDVRRAAPASVFQAWLHPLHDGSAGGLPLRIALFVAGLLPLALFVTGGARWLKLSRRPAGRRRTNS